MPTPNQNLPKLKLSPAQKHVIQRMCEGWELGFSPNLRNIGGTYKLQRGWLGSGREVETVRGNIFNGLRNKGIIIVVRTAYPFQIYGLTERGKQIARFNGWLKEETE